MCLSYYDSSTPEEGVAVQMYRKLIDKEPRTIDLFNPFGWITSNEKIYVAYDIDSSNVQYPLLTPYDNDEEVSISRRK